MTIIIQIQDHYLHTWSWHFNAGKNITRIAAMSNKYISPASISSSFATFSNLTIGGAQRVGINKYNGGTSGSVGSNLGNIVRNGTVIGNSPAIRRQNLEMGRQRVIHTTRKTMVSGRLVTETVEEIIPNFN